MKKILIFTFLGMCVITALSQTECTFTGTGAGNNNTTGDYNTFTGYRSGYNNTTGRSNTFTGRKAGYYNISGTDNTFTGTMSGNHNTTGSYNTFTGRSAGLFNISGVGNTFTGYNSGYFVSTGWYNSFYGQRSGENNTTGCYNTFIGALSGFPNVSGGQNTAIGHGAGFTEDCFVNATAIGFNAIASFCDRVRIGNNSVTRIGGQVSWSTLSDGRFKKDVEEKVAGLEFIKKLHPVSYTVDIEKLNEFMGIKETDSLLTKSTLQAAPRKQIGFVAQEVEQLIKENGYEFTGVDVPQNEKDHYAIRYAEFVVPLVKAVQELSTIVENQQRQIEQLLVINSLEAIDMQSFNSSENGVRLSQNIPNPSTGNMEIKMYIPDNISHAELRIIDMKGSIVKSIPVNSRGDTSVQFNGDRLEIGTYLYTLIADGRITDFKTMSFAK